MKPTSPSTEFEVTYYRMIRHPPAHSCWPNSSFMKLDDGYFKCCGCTCKIPGLLVQEVIKESELVYFLYTSKDTPIDKYVKRDA